MDDHKKLSPDLKKGIDNIGVSVRFIVHDGIGKILLQKRGPGSRDERGNWEAGGGAVEFGESLEAAVRRELKEELLAVPLEIQFITAYEVHRKHQGQITHWIALIHSVKVEPSTVAIGEPENIAEIGWFNLATLPHPLHTQFNKTLKIAQDSGLIK
jgi:8-oxo-dGTP diphosphatase